MCFVGLALRRLIYSHCKAFFNVLVCIDVFHLQAHDMTYFDLPVLRNKTTNRTFIGLVAQIKIVFIVTLLKGN